MNRDEFREFRTKVAAAVFESRIRRWRRSMTPDKFVRFEHRRRAKRDDKPPAD